MFVQSAKFIQAHSNNRGAISVYGQESNADTWKMAKMNMAIRGIDADFGSYHADTFFNDLHPTLKADFIMANPPFNLSNWGQDKLQEDVRWKYGIPPAGNANYAWIQHMIHHLAPNGKIYVCPAVYFATPNNYIGSVKEGIDKDKLILYSVDESPVCSNCSVKQCKRCIFLNKEYTGESVSYTHLTLPTILLV